MTDEPVVGDIQDEFLGASIRGHHHQPHKFKHTLHDHRLQMQPIDGPPLMLHNRPIVVHHDLLDILEFLLVLEHAAVEEPDFEGFESELLFSYCGDPGGEVYFPLVDALLLLEVLLTIVVCIRRVVPPESV